MARRHIPFGASFTNLLKPGILCLGTLLFASTLSCKPPQVDLSKKPRSYESHQYEDVWERWTRHDKSFEDIIVNIRVWATYWSHDFCYAYAAKHSHLFGRGPRHAKTFLKNLLEEKSKNHEFLMSVVTQEPSWNNFADKETNWRLALITDKGVEVEPVDIELVNPVTATHKTFFHQIKLFYRTYQVHFPRKVNGAPVLTPNTKYFILRIAGVKGKLDLRWSVKQ